MNAPIAMPEPPGAEGEQRETVRVTVNGETVERTVSTRRLLTDFLRHDLGLTGTHVGCEHGVCGACTVMIDGETARACLTLAIQTDGAAVTTVEGLSGDGAPLGPVQQAFKDCHALQCGYCTPGFLMVVTDYLAQNPDADLSEAAIRDALAGNLCRCTGYQRIVDAVRRAHALMYPG